MGKKWKTSETPTSEFIYLDKMSSRDATIYIANKYKDDILKENFLSSSIHYDKLAKDLGITSSELYMYFTHRLKINDLSNSFDQQAEYGEYDWMSRVEKDQRKKKIAKAKKDQINYKVFHVWKVLAFYCKFYSYKKAKSVLKTIQRYHYTHKKKGWTIKLKQRFQEVFTPLFFPDEDYKFSKMLICKVTGKEKNGIYKAELVKTDQKEDNIFRFKDHYTPQCLVIPNEVASIKRIDEFLKKKKSPIVIGLRDNPLRNITNTILDVKLRA